MQHYATFYVPFYRNMEHEDSCRFPAFEEAGPTYEMAAKAVWERAARHSGFASSIFTATFPLIEIKRCAMVVSELEPEERKVA